jgi:hypothetical protein
MRRLVILLPVLLVAAFITGCDTTDACAGSDPGVAPAGYPTPATVGLPTGWSPTQVIDGDLTIEDPNTTYTDVEVNGSINVMAENTRLCRVRVHGRIWNQFSSPTGLHQWSFFVADSTVGDPDNTTNEVTADGAIGPGRYTAVRNQVYGLDGFRVSEPHQGGDNDVNISNNYFRANLFPCSAGFHLDGVQGYFGGQDVMINHNTLDITADCGSNGAVFMADCSESAVVIQNLLVGGGFDLRIHDDHGNDRPEGQCIDPSTGQVATHDIGPWIIAGNRMAAYAFGPVLTTNTECDNTQSMPYWLDNRTAVIDANYTVTSTGPEVLCSGALVN